MRGKIKRRVVVYSNDMEHNAVALSVEAHIQPELRVDPACGPETECVESGYIIVEGHGHGRNREKIPVLIRNVPLAR
jgi:hypothetical protein